MVNISLPPTDKGVTLPCANGKKPILNAEYIARHCTMFQNKTTSRLVSSQTEIEKRVTKSLQTLRHRQLTLSHGHCKRQIRSHGTTTSNTGNCVSRMQGIENRCNEATPPLGSPETSVDSINSSFDLSLPSPCAPDSSSQEATAETSYTLQKHLQCLENFVDDEATCSSSDEEDDVAGILTKKKQDQKHLKLVALIDQPRVITNSIKLVKNLLILHQASMYVCLVTNYQYELPIVYKYYVHSFYLCPCV